MNCLDEKRLMRIETRKEWESIERKYEGHCSFCDALLSHRREKVLAKIEELDRFCNSLHISDSRDDDLEETERENIVVDFLRSIIAKMGEIMPGDDPWQLCHDICAKLDIKNMRGSRGEIEREVWESLWAASIDRNYYLENGKNLPQDWEKQLLALLRGEKTGLSIVRSAISTMESIEYEIPVKMAAAIHKSRFEEETQRRQKLANPIWSYSGNKLRLSVIYHKEALWLEAFSEELQTIRIFYQCHNNRSEEREGKNFLYILLGAVDEMKKPWQLKIWIDEILQFDKMMPGFEGKRKE